MTLKSFTNKASSYSVFITLISSFTNNTFRLKLLTLIMVTSYYLNQCSDPVHRCIYASIGMADSRFAPSQWETALLCNDVSHWLDASLESVLIRDNDLTYWGRVTHICVVKQIIIGSDKGLSPRRRQAIIWTNAGILLIGPWGTNFSEILIGIQTFSFKQMQLKMPSAKWRLFCLGLNVLIAYPSSQSPLVPVMPTSVQYSPGGQRTQSPSACRPVSLL